MRARGRGRGCEGEGWDRGRGLGCGCQDEGSKEGLRRVRRVGRLSEEDGAQDGRKDHRRLDGRPPQRQPQARVISIDGLFELRARGAWAGEATRVRAACGRAKPRGSERYVGGRSHA
eukprot:4337408-Prymnesium_polylepis.1